MADHTWPSLVPRLSLLAHAIKLDRLISRRISGRKAWKIDLCNRNYGTTYAISLIHRLSKCTNPLSCIVAYLKFVPKPFLLLCESHVVLMFEGSLCKLWHKWRTCSIIFQAFPPLIPSRFKGQQLIILTRRESLGTRLTWPYSPTIQSHSSQYIGTRGCGPATYMCTCTCKQVLQHVECTDKLNFNLICNEDRAALYLE